MNERPEDQSTKIIKIIKSMAYVLYVSTTYLTKNACVGQAWGCGPRGHPLHVGAFCQICLVFFLVVTLTLFGVLEEIFIETPIFHTRREEQKLSWALRLGFRVCVTLQQWLKNVMPNTTDVVILIVGRWFNGSSFSIKLKSVCVMSFK